MAQRTLSVILTVSPLPILECFLPCDFHYRVGLQLPGFYLCNILFLLETRLADMFTNIFRILFVSGRKRRAWVGRCNILQISVPRLSLWILSVLLPVKPQIFIVTTSKRTNKNTPLTKQYTILLGP